MDFRKHITNHGAELDLFFQGGGRSWGVEFKFADAPKLTRSMRIAQKDLSLEHLWVVYPGKERYRLDQRVTVVPLAEVDGIEKRVRGAE